MITQDKIITRFLEQSAEYLGLNSAATSGATEGGTVTLPGYFLNYTACGQEQTSLIRGDLR